MHESRDGGSNAGGTGVMVGSVTDQANLEDVQYVSFVARAAAAVIDVIVMQVGSMFINALFLGMLLGNLTSGNMILATVGPLMVGGAFALFYTVWLESSPWQATLGKRMLGIKVVDLQGRRIGLGMSSWRNMAKGLSMLTLGVGYLMPLWDHRRQALHDKAAGCLVIRATRESAAGRVARFA